MPLLSDSLSVWEIGLRWAGHDPYKFRLFLPLEARDNFRMMIDAIWQAELECETLSINKWKEADGEDMKPFFMRYHWAEIEACIAGNRPSRKLLKWAQISRGEMEEWCQGHGMPLPAFWFPPGWNRDFKWPKYGEDEPAPNHPEEGEAEKPGGRGRFRVACQVIAESIWKDEPEKTIADMVKDVRIQKLGGAAWFVPEVVRRWLSDVAPAKVKAKRGRPAKKTPRNDQEGESVDASPTQD